MRMQQVVVRILTTLFPTVVSITGLDRSDERINILSHIGAGKWEAPAGVLDWAGAPTPSILHSS